MKNYFNKEFKPWGLSLWLKKKINYVGNDLCVVPDEGHGDCPFGSQMKFRQGHGDCPFGSQMKFVTEGKPKGLSPVSFRRALTLTLSLTLILGLLTSSFAYDPYLEQGIPVPEFRGSTVDIEDRTELLGYSKGGELLQNSIFVDTPNH